VRATLFFPADAATYIRGMTVSELFDTDVQVESKRTRKESGELPWTGGRTFAKDNLDESADIGAVAIFEDIR
jgi:hypothetical protein